jgi:hypothetical protein
VSVGLLLAGAASAATVSAASPAKAHPQAKIITATLTAVSVAPHSTTAYAYGTQSTAKASTTYALRRSGTHWSKQSLKLSKTAAVYALAAGSPKSAWLVGDIYDTAAVVTHVLIEHSSGHGFKPQATKVKQGQLLAVSASSASNAWAIGDGLASSTPLIMHWNGKKWQQMPDTKQTGFNYNAVSTSSPTNVWMLGSSTTGLVATVWNGHKLTVHKITLPSGASINRIATTSAKNTWVSGTVVAGVHNRAFVERWDGKKWKVVKVPGVGYQTQPQALAASGSHAYLAGYSYPKSGLSTSAFVLRYSGGKWTSESVARPGKFSYLSSISVSSKGGAAVGSWSLRGQCGVKHPTPNLPLVENLGGSSWHKGSAPLIRFGIATLRVPDANPQGIARC